MLGLQRIAMQSAFGAAELEDRSISYLIKRALARELANTNGTQHG